MKLSRYERLERDLIDFIEWKEITEEYSSLPPIVDELIDVLKEILEYEDFC